MTRLQRDLISSYALSLSRIGSWAAVFAIVWRQLGPEAFAVLALARSTIGVLRVTGLGLGPATLRLLAEERGAEVAATRRAEKGTFLFSAAGDVPNPDDAAAENRNVPFSAADPFSAVNEGDATPKAEQSEASDGVALGYEPAVNTSSGSPNGAITGTVAGVVMLIGFIYGDYFDIIHRIPAMGAVTASDAGGLITFLTLAVLARIVGDPLSARLQVDSRLALDNSIGVLVELAWPVLTVVLTLAIHTAFQQPSGLPNALLEPQLNLSTVGIAAFIAEACGTATRLGAAGMGTFAIRLPLRRLLTLGGFITLAQAADYLYAPVDYILLNRFVPGGIETYAPAVMFDSALLLVGSGIAAVVLPYSALADARGDTASVRRQYVKGTAASVALLVVGAGVIWLAAPVAFQLWLGQDLPATRAILPLVLLHTIIGGSGAVGRSVLLGMGRAKALAVSVLIAGAANAIISTAAVLLGYGLVGVIAGTLIAVFGRCVLWMPWYILRQLRPPTAPAAPW